MDRQFSRAIRAYLSLAEYRASHDDDSNSDQQETWDGAQRPKEMAGTAAAAAVAMAAPNKAGLDDGEEGGEKGRGGGGNGNGEGEAQYAHVFRMIEQHSLFDTVQVSKEREGWRRR